MSENATLSERYNTLIDAYNTLRSKKIIKTWTDFARLLDSNRACLSSAKGMDERYLTDSLISKIQAVMKRYETSSITDGYGPHPEPEEHVLRDSEPAPKYGTSNLVPTVPYKTYNETGVNIIEYVKCNRVPMSPAIAQFAKTDLHMFVANDEMKPHLRAGDVLSLKQVSMNAPIINGEIYVVNSQHLGLTIRYLYDRGDSYELRSSNEWYETFMIPKEQVFSIFRILGLVRTNI